MFDYTQQQKCYVLKSTTNKNVRDYFSRNILNYFEKKNLYRFREIV